ncbi:MAG: hypothetical protein J4F34_05090, partial [Gemmatimonadetes bacterium]|nr:hypothetical protein [Gemmatimonadota bacterium]
MRYRARRSSPDISSDGIKVSSQKQRGTSSPGRSTTTCTTLRERDHDPARYDDSQTQARGSPPPGAPLFSASQTTASIAGSARRFSTALL